MASSSCDHRASEQREFGGRGAISEAASAPPACNVHLAPGGLCLAQARMQTLPQAMPGRQSSKPAFEKHQAYVQGKTLKDRNVYKIIQTVHACACVRVCMCVSACQHVCVCIWACMCMCGVVWACVNVCKCVCVHVWECAYLSMCECVWACVCMCELVWVCVCLCECVCLCDCVCMCEHVWMCVRVWPWVNVCGGVVHAWGVNVCEHVCACVSVHLSTWVEGRRIERAGEEIHRIEETRMELFTASATNLVQRNVGRGCIHLTVGILVRHPQGMVLIDSKAILDQESVTL